MMVLITVAHTCPSHAAQNLIGSMLVIIPVMDVLRAVCQDRRGYVKA